MSVPAFSDIAKSSNDVRGIPNSLNRGCLANLSIKAPEQGLLPRHCRYAFHGVLDGERELIILHSKG